MDRDNPRTLREQLAEAITNVRRQIDVQRRTHGGLDVVIAPAGSEEAILELEAELVQLEKALAGLGPEDA
jgi:hypothetical protein